MARDGEGIGARPRLVGEPGRTICREAHLHAGGGQRLAAGDLRQAGEGLGLGAVGAEAEAPCAVARLAVERAVVDLAQGEGDVERLARGEGKSLGERDEIGGVGAEEAPVEAAVEAPGRARRRGYERADIGEAHLGEIGRRQLGERLDHPARLQRPVGEDADAQLLLQWTWR